MSCQQCCSHNSAHKGNFRCKICKLHNFNIKPECNAWQLNEIHGGIYWLPLSYNSQIIVLLAWKTSPRQSEWEDFLSWFSWGIVSLCLALRRHTSSCRTHFNANTVHFLSTTQIMYDVCGTKTFWIAFLRQTSTHGWVSVSVSPICEHLHVSVKHRALETWLAWLNAIEWHSISHVTKCIYCKVINYKQQNWEHSRTMTWQAVHLTYWWGDKNSV